MNDMDRVRAVLDQCADDTRTGKTTYADIYNAYESAINAISRIAYPEDKP